jgi:hypothetical protein
MYVNVRAMMLTPPPFIPKGRATWTAEAEVGDRKREGFVNRHVLLGKGVKHSLPQCGRLPRLGIELGQRLRWRGRQVQQRPVLQLSQVLEESQGCHHNVFVVFHLQLPAE